MKDFRIRTDVKVKWKARINKGQVQPDETNLKVVLVDEGGHETYVKHVVEDGKLVFIFQGTQQRTLGRYRATLWANDGKFGTGAIDHVDVFNLVPLTTLIGTGQDDDNLETENVVEIEDEMEISLQGPSAYYTWRSLGLSHHGDTSEMGFMLWLQAPAKEAAEGAEKVNATLEGTTIHVTDRDGNTKSADLKGAQGDPGVSGSILYPTMRINAAGHLVGRIPEKSDLGGNLYINSAGHFCMKIPNVNQ